MGLGSSGMASDRTRGNEYKLEPRRLHLRENFFTVRVVEQFAQRGSGVSFSGDIQAPTGFVPAQPDPALPGRLS